MRPDHLLGITPDKKPLSDPLTMRGKNNLTAYLFSLGILILASLLRSGSIVDKSFLPRFLLLNLILIIVVICFLKKTFFHGSLYEVVFFLFYAWCMLSSLWSILPSEAIMESQLVLGALGVFLVVSALKDGNPAFERIFIRVLLLLLFFSFALAFYKMSTLEYFDPYKIISVSSNNNLYAGFLLISLPLVIAGYALQKGFWRYLSTAAGILDLFFIIIVQSRAVYLGLTVGALILFLLMLAKYRRLFSHKNILTGTTAMILLFAGIFLFYSTLDKTRKGYFLSKIPVWNYFLSYEDLAAEQARRLQEFSAGDLNHMPEFDYAEEYYQNASLRYIFWKKSFPLILKNPVVGVGAGNWRLAVPSSKEPPNPNHTLMNYTYSQPHNEWICFLSELGIVGFLLALIVYLLPPGLILHRLFRTGQSPPFQKIIYTSFVIGFYAFACFDFPFHRIEHNILLFSVLAFMTDPAGLRLVNFKSLKKNNGSSFNFNFFFNLIFIVLLLFSLTVGIFRITGEYFTLKMFREERKNDISVIHYCRKAENIFYRITPNTLPLKWFEGVAYYRMNNIPAAAGCFSKAIHSAPYEVRVLNDYGISLYTLHQEEKGKSLLLKSFWLDPYFDDAKFNLAVIYHSEGRNDSALYYVDQCRDSEKKSEYLKELVWQK